MPLHHEIEFENDICNHLGTHGWLYAAGDAERYDAARSLFPPDVVDWVKASQPQVWDALVKSHGEAGAETVLCWTGSASRSTRWARWRSCAAESTSPA
jgi:type I restriction enzyme R subunit